MRRFEEKNFPQDATDALNSRHRFNVSADAAVALDYITQFIVGPVDSKELLRGYLPEKYATALVEYRDENSDFSLNSAVNRLCVDGDCSSDVTSEFTTFEQTTVPADFALSQELSNHYSEFNDNEVRKNVSTMRELIEENTGSIEIYLPKKTVERLSDVNILPYTT